MKSTTVNRHLTFPAVFVPTLAFLSGSAVAAVVTTPAIIGSGTPFDGSYTAANLFDGSKDTDYASQGGGAAGTWVALDFGAAVSIDRVVLVTRNNNVDVVGGSQLIYSTDATFDGSDPVIDLGAAGDSGIGKLVSFASISSRYVKWQVTTSGSWSNNLGGNEMRFLSTPAGTEIHTPTVIGGYAAYNGDYALQNAANGVLGTDYSGREYATNAGGTGTYVDFDMGATISIAGFDFFDRIGAVDRITAFDLIFSNDPAFVTTVDTRSFAPGSQWGYGETFTPVDARYVRFQATAGVGGNPGMQEMIFYKSTVPEPSVPVLGISILGAGLLIRQRS